MTPAASGSSPTSRARRSHAIVRQALELLINLEHRGACGSDPDTGDGAGILIQMPDRFLRKSVAFPLPPAGAYGAGLVFLPADARAQSQLRGARRAHRRGGGPGRARLADGAGQPERGGPQRRRRGAGVRADLHRAAPRPTRRPTDRARFERKLYVDPQADRARRGRPRPSARGAQGLLHRQPVGEHAHLQGHAHGIADRADVPGSVGPGARIGAGARAPALLDQHVPVVAAGPPIPLRGAQRRDQHAARQHQLDAGARGPAPLERARRRPEQGPAGHHAGRQRHGHVRQRARVPGDGGAVAPARRADDDPRAVVREPRRWTRRSARSTSTTRR